MKNDAEERASNEDRNDEPLEAIVDEAIEAAEDGDVSLKNIMTAWGDRSYGPLFILLGFFAGTPLAAIPFLAAGVGLVISLLAIQMVFGKAHPWLPNFALNWSVDEEDLKEMRKKSAPTLKFIDHLITERMTFAANAFMRRLAAAIVFLLGIAMVPLDAVPMVVGAPAWAIVLFGVAVTARDGLVMLLALAATGGVGYLLVTVLV